MTEGDVQRSEHLHKLALRAGDLAASRDRQGRFREAAIDYKRAALLEEQAALCVPPWMAYSRRVLLLAAAGYWLSVLGCRAARHLGCRPRYGEGA